MMKFFENTSKAEENQNDFEQEQPSIQDEAEKQDVLKEKLDELILVGKAVYTILKQEREERQNMYENIESLIQAATSEIISMQEKAAKATIAYSRENNQNVTSVVEEELVKLQKVTAVAQKHLLAASEELNNSIIKNTAVLEHKLGSRSDMEPVEPVHVFEEAARETTVQEEPDIMAMPHLEEMLPLEEEMEEEAFEIPAPVPEPEETDPNRAMTPDEIAALLASMSED